MRNNIRMILLLALLSAFPPLSTDMYLPAMPLLQKAWGQSLTTINLTLSGFFIGFCLSMLFYGPLSDKYGRKPPLIFGIVVFTVASLLSGFVNSIEALIVLRVLQGIGAAASMVISMAITKDLFEGNERQRILAYMAVIIALAPMLAPVLGGVFMVWLSWHWIFYAQALMGIIALVGVVRMRETLKKPSDKSVWLSMGMYGELFRNRKYLKLVALFSLIVFVPFSFIGSAKDIYITHFGLSPQGFSYFFAFNAVSLMAGAFACSQVQRGLSSENIMNISFSGMLVAGIIMGSGFMHGPWGFALPMGMLSFFFGLGRPTSNHLIFQQIDEGAGSASSLMVFFYFMLGAFAAWFISLDWSDTILVIARIGVVTNGIALIGGLMLFRNNRKFVLCESHKN